MSIRDPESRWEEKRCSSLYRCFEPANMVVNSMRNVTEKSP